MITRWPISWRSGLLLLCVDSDAKIVRVQPHVPGKVSMAEAVMGQDQNRGVVFQDFAQLFPWRTARRNVEFGLEMRGVPHPGTVRAQLKLDLPRPRDLLSTEFVAMQREVLRHLTH